MVKCLNTSCTRPHGERIIKIRVIQWVLPCTRHRACFCLVLWCFNPLPDLTLNLSLFHGNLELGSILLYLLRMGTDLSGTPTSALCTWFYLTVISSLAPRPSSAYCTSSLTSSHLYKVLMERWGSKNRTGTLNPITKAHSILCFSSF